jgi:hypothetical protein
MIIPPLLCSFLPSPCQDLNALFLEMIPALQPESLRMLTAHVARTANVAASDPGLPVGEVQKALGIGVGAAMGGEPARCWAWAGLGLLG